jgi:hypothetical protein
MQFVAFGERRIRLELHTRYAPTVALVGIAIALAVTFVPVLLDRAVLTHAPPPNAPVVHLGTVELITAFAFDVGVFLLVVGFSVSSFSFVAREEERTAS